MPPKRKPGRRPNGQPPDLCFYKPRQAACVYLNGTRRLLGPWGSAEAKAAYAQVVADWQAANRSRLFTPSGRAVSVADWIAAFISHAEVYYRGPDQLQTDEVRGFRNALAPLLAFDNRPVDDLAFEDIVAIRDAWVAADLERGYVNKQIGRIKRALRWGKRERLVSASVIADIDDVPLLPKGRSVAREKQPITPADLRAVHATLRLLPRSYRDAVMVQLRCGARPGEVCRMHVSEIHEREVEVGGEVLAIPPGCWAFVPSRHKTKWRGKVVVYVIGPKLQRRLRPLLARGGYLFPGKRSPHFARNRYTTDIGEAAKRVGAEAWSPRMLRHNFLTRRKRKASRERARAAVMHTSATMTDNYIERDLIGVGADALKWD